MRVLVLALIPFLLAADAPGIPAVRLEKAWPEIRFERPVFLAWAPGVADRCFVVEQDGRILALPLQGEAKPFLDIASRVLRYHEEAGLLGLAFHPRFAENGFLYVYYSDRSTWKRTQHHTARLSRFKATADAADPASEAVLLEVHQPYANHNGGGLLFGPDGHLYLGLGDGGAAGDPQGNAQNPESLLGKMLRIDVNDPGGKPEIYASGLRNPWRFSFDRQTGDLWVGDVGQDRWEEIDLVVKGGNYGWKPMEGMHPYRKGENRPEFIAPVAEYGHELGVSVTGGYVYRGKRFPELTGVYFYADYVSGRLWGMRKGAEPVELLRNAPSISSFAEDPDGEVFAISLNGGIWRIVPK